VRRSLLLLLDHRQHLAAGHRGAVLQPDFLEQPGCGRRNLENDLVGLQVDEVLIARHGITRLLVPRHNRGVSHRLRQLRHANFNSHQIFGTETRALRPGSKCRSLS